jgi:KaiC/GvpD/RAD55 family RecA-like ATPase
VLGLCLRDPKFLSSYIDVIDYTFFENQHLSNLAMLTLNHFKRHGKIPSRDSLVFDIREFSNKYDKDKSEDLEGSLLHWLGYVYERNLDEEAITTRIVKFGQRQAVRLAMYETVELLQRDTGVCDESDDTNETIARKFNEACQKGTGRDFGLNWHEIAPNLQHLIKTSVTAMTKVPLGIEIIDAILNGGVGAEELAVVMGPPNKGKSTFLVCVGMAAMYYLARKAKEENKAPKAVIHITCEMGALAIMTKYGSAATHMAINDVKGGHPDFNSLVAAQLPHHAPLWVKHFLPGKTSVEELKWFIANLKMVENIDPGLVIVDYADRLKGGEDDRFKGMGQIYDGLIEISKKFEVPVWTGSQVRRFNAKDDLIDETGAAESWKKVEAADILVSLNQKELEYGDRIMRLYFAKVRDGEAKKIFFVKFDHATCTLRALSDEELAEHQKKATDTETMPGARPPPFANGNGKPKKCAGPDPTALDKADDFMNDPTPED